MTAQVLMIQGTGSDVGKSVIVAGLCRLARRRGMDVAPFKPQNMSNNAAACKDGGEIGRAQALQARAAGQEPRVDFNPVLLKPQTDRDSQVVVHGHPLTVMEAAEFIDRRDTLMPAVLDSFSRLAGDHELIVVEGAGSPAEINLRHRDIANMGFARAAGIPVCLLGDIERGGVIASLAGTRAVIDPADAAMIVGFAVNKFRGNIRLFDDGIDAIENLTGWPCFGVIPWLPAVARLPAEDAVALERCKRRPNRSLSVVAPMLSRIANFDDADPLRLEPQVDFTFVPPGQPLPRDADLIILFGTKSTLGDLAFLRQQGWDHDVLAHARSGGHVLGLCGGYQMLGTRIIDTAGVDGAAGEAAGLGLLDIETRMTGAKTVRPVNARCAISGQRLAGYEIHAGRTTGPALERPLLQLDSGPDGARSENGRIAGTYVHGLLANDRYRGEVLNRLRSGMHSELDYEPAVDSALDELADGLEAALDVERLFAAARTPGWAPAET